MKRFAIALTALALAVPAAMAQSGGGSAGSGGSSGSSGSAGSGSSSGSSSSAGSGSSIGSGSATGRSSAGQAGSGQIGGAGQGAGGQSDAGTGSRAGSLGGDATRTPIGDRPDARLGGQGNPQFEGQSGQRTQTDRPGDRQGGVGQAGRSDQEGGARPGAADQRQFDGGAGRFDDPARRDRQFDDRTFDDRRSDARRNDRSRDGQTRGDQFDDGRFSDQRGAGEGRGARPGDSPGAAERQRRVRWIGGRWWFQRNSGEWLSWDSRVAEWRPFDPTMLEQSIGRR